jgi:hypothetical protein
VNLTSISEAQKSKSKKMDFPFGTWMRSQEEDKDPNSDWKLYRPSTFDFPAARGRSGFTCKKDGKFAIINPSSTDGVSTAWGKWTFSKTGIYNIEVAEGAPKTISWRLVKKGLIEVKFD